MRQLPPMPVQSSYWAFRGGLDQVTPALSMPPGHCRASSNVEIGTEGGLITTAGYERYDGQARPSDAAYHILTATITGSYALGNTLAGATSGATGVIIAVVAATATADAYFVLTKVVGTFSSGENLQIAAVTIAVSTAASMQGAASTPARDATYRNLAADNYRSDIAAVPGSGSILGVWKYNDTIYALRNNAGSTAAAMYKSTTSGWSLVNLGRELAFTSGGTHEIVAGEVITGAISGATATVGRVVLTSGTWGAGTAAGFLYFASQTGTFQAENLDVGATLNVGTIAANSSAITLTKSGRYEFVNANFGGSGGTLRMYGVSGVHKGFEFDGTTFAFVTTGMSTDTPAHVTVFKNHLFYAFGASVQHSSIANPLSWSVILGAAEIAMGEDVTNFVDAPGGTSSGALVITTRNQTKILYGNSSADWNLVNFNPNVGALAHTAQYALGRQVWLDDRGITDLQTAQEFGNFRGSDLSRLIAPTVKALRSSVIASCVVREKNQYRLFFSGGDALYTTFVGNKVAGIMPIALTNPVTCACSLESGDGVEETFFGSTNGFVYQMDKGTSQDGEVIAWTVQMAFNHFGGPRQLKTFRKVVTEVSGAGYCEFEIGYTLGYGTTDLPTGDTTIATSALASANWDGSITWDAAYWDGRALAPTEVDLDGTAENLSLVYAGNSDEFEQLTLNGAIVDYTPRRQLR